MLMSCKKLKVLHQQLPLEIPFGVRAKRSDECHMKKKLVLERTCQNVHPVEQSKLEQAVIML